MRIMRPDALGQSCSRIRFGVTVLCLVISTGCSTKRVATVEWVQNGGHSIVSADRAHQLEALAVELLASSSYEADSTVANAEIWGQYEAQPHLRFAYARPRRVATLPGEAFVSDMLIPIVSPDHAPAYVFVRDNGRIRAFAKYSCESWIALSAAIGD